MLKARIRWLMLAATGAVLTFGTVFASAAPGSGLAGSVARLPMTLELVGEVTNTATGVTPATSTQLAYLSYVAGLKAFNGEPENETTALFTVYAQLDTTRVISDGPLRIITRLGRVTVYRDLSANSRFSEPDTFRDGTPVLVAAVRQQVVLDTVSGTFRVVIRNTLTATKAFAGGSRRVQIGVVGAKFETVLSGRSNTPGPPSGYFAGYTVAPH